MKVISIETCYKIIDQKINFATNYFLNKKLHMKSFNTYLENLDMNFLRNLCVENGKLFHYNKGDYFCRISDKKSLFGFIETGSFKYTITNYKGEERITGFVFDNTPVGDALNIVTNSQIRTDIIALTKSKVFVCNGSILTDIL